MTTNLLYAAKVPAAKAFSLADFLKDLGPEFDFWPFSMGMHESFLFSVSRIAFMVIIMGAILLLLRVLFGPKGIWRDHELDRMAEEEAARELADLDARFERGELDETLYNMERKRLSRWTPPA